MAGTQGPRPHLGAGVAVEAGARPVVAHGWRTLAGVEINGSYANLSDLVTLSLPQDTAHDYRTNVLISWLIVGASRINEVLGQRFEVPLRTWSQTVVWANCELAVIGATRQRGINTEADAFNINAREGAVKSWLEAARDHEITPDQRLSNNDRSRALCYIAPDPYGRGWDAIGRGRR